MFWMGVEALVLANTSTKVLVLGTGILIETCGITTLASFPGSPCTNWE